MTRSLPLLAAVLLAFPASHAHAQTPAPPARQAFVRLSHDSGYLYAAWEVDDTHLAGSVREISPGSFPSILQDDSVALYLRSGDKTIAFLVSVGGGFAFLENGKPIPIFNVKFAPTPRGTVNLGTDRDQGFDVEQAIPWSALGIDPGAVRPDLPLQVCLVVRKRGAEVPAVYPASAKIDDPTTWPKLPLQAGEGLVAPPTTNAPQIDGILKTGEWSAAVARFPVADPAPAMAPSLEPLAITPLLPADTAAPVLRSAAVARGRRVFTRHLPTHNADLLKRTAPQRGVFGTDGSFLAIDQPTIGFGPWYSSDRIGWHRAELQLMARAGIDTVLTVVNGAGLNTSPFDAKALTLMVAARRELDREREVTPDFGLWLETGTLATSPPDLATDAGRDILYRGIARWFEIVPPEMRARVRVAAQTPSGTAFAYPVFLNDAAGVAHADNSEWADALRARFAADFGARSAGATLVFIGAKGYDAARMPLIASLPETGTGAGTIRAARVRPGSQAPFAARRQGDTYKATWQAARDADWIVIDSWNDFAAGTEIAPTRQYGDTYLALTRLFGVTTLPENAPAAALVFDIPDLPRRVQPRQLLPIDFPLRNVGTRPLASGDVTLTYKWMRGDTTVAEGANQGQPRGPLAPGIPAWVRLGIATVGPGSAPLEPGDYLLRIEARTPGGGAVLDQAVTISAEDSVEFGGSTLPPAVYSGGDYPASVRVRLAGTQALANGAARVVWQIVTADGKRVVTGGEEPIRRALPPSLWVNLPVSLKIAEQSGAPLEPAFPERQVDAPNDPNRWDYRLRWAIARDDGRLLPGGGEQRLAVYPAADAARVEVVRLDSSKAIGADSLFKATVRVANTGTERWLKGKIALTGRWFQSDGFPMPLTVALPSIFIERDVPVGEAVEIEVPCRAPIRAGRYVLGIFVTRPPDGYFALQPITGTADTAFVPVSVTGGKLEMIDLKKLFDTDAVAPEPQPADGDFDGSGATFPAEWFPADRYGTSANFSEYPSGYFSDIASEIVRSITFDYGSAQNGQKNAVACRGQEIGVPKGRYVALHLAAASSTAKPATFSVTLRYKDGKTETIQREVRSWAAPVVATEAIALRVPRRRTASGDVGDGAALQHVVIPVQPGAELVAVSLPSQPEIKVFAITLER